MTVLEEIELGLFTGFEDTTALEDKKGLTFFSAKLVVDCATPEGLQGQRGLLAIRL